MIPLIKNVLLASSDQVAIDAIASRMMGFDPLSDVKCIRLAHERGLGCGDPKEIEIVGDEAVAAENWHFVGPFKKMTFAARMQHRIYWGRLKTFLEWSLRTWLAPWAYIASVIYHDSFWYPFRGRSRVCKVLGSEWGRLFNNWEEVQPTEAGYPIVGPESPTLVRSTSKLLALAMRILITCIREAPEVATRKRRKASAPR
jgi:hypothetical protein